MMKSQNRTYWIRWSVINLAILASFGFLLRSKLLFPLPAINYRNIMSAHSHFAFSGWVGLALTTLLIYNLLPQQQAQKKIYQMVLGAIVVSSLGMALLFPFTGYSIAAIVFSSLYIVANYVFGWVYLKDIFRYQQNPTVKLLSVSAVLSLLISAIGPLGLLYIIVTGSSNSILYRDSVYTFLHFQYNGFFTLSVFALLFHEWLKKSLSLPVSAHRFSVFLIASIVPTLCMSLLWHGLDIFFYLSVAGALLILISLFYFFKSVSLKNEKIFQQPFARFLLTFSMISFIIKMLLNVGTLELHHAIYSNRPVIIGFLHLVFLAFVSFYLLGYLIEQGYFHQRGKLIRAPFLVFCTGVFANELFLGVQGLTILFQTNSWIYQWLLWFASIFLMVGAIMIAFAFVRNNKKAVEASTA